MIVLPSKLPDVKDSIFSKMTQMSVANNAINLAQGFPEFEPVAFLVEKLAYYVANGKNQYAQASGVWELREQLGIKYNCDPETEVTITSGASEALFNAIAAIVSPGKEVVIIEPAYDLYGPVVKLFGGVVVPIKMTYPHFTIDWDEVKDKVNPNTRAIIINTPHNPTGKTLDKEDLRILEEIVSLNPQLLLISDEVYEHIVFDNREFLSIRSSPILRERTFLCSSFAKAMHITGWKIGYCIAPEKLSIELKKIHQFNTFCVFPAAQYAIADYLKSNSSISELSSFYQKKRDLFVHALQNSSFTILGSEATFFQNLYYGDASSLSDVEMCELLTTKVKVGCIPTSAFYADATDHKILRFCFAKNDNTLLEAAERLKDAARYW